MSDEESDDNIPISVLIANKKKSSDSKISSKFDSSATKTSTSDSEDDIPIFELIKKRERESNSIKVTNLSKKIKTEKSVVKAEHVLRAIKNDDKNDFELSKNSKVVKVQSKVRSWSEFYLNTSKGHLVQSLLVRWWYAYDWPLPEEIGLPPKGFEPLDGFPGVFVSTRTDSLGKILDLRDKTNCPCLANFEKKSSAELKELCIKAYENQMSELIEVAGKEDNLLFVLKNELREIKHIDPKAADKEVKKIEYKFGK